MRKIEILGNQGVSNDEKVFISFEEALEKVFISFEEALSIYSAISDMFLLDISMDNDMDCKNVVILNQLNGYLRNWKVMHDLRKDRQD